MEKTNANIKWTMNRSKSICKYDHDQKKTQKYKYKQKSYQRDINEEEW